MKSNICGPVRHCNCCDMMMYCSSGGCDRHCVSHLLNSEEVVGMSTADSLLKHFKGPLQHFSAAPQ